MYHTSKRYKRSELVYISSLDGYGNKTKQYATVVTWLDFVHYYQNVYGFENGLERAKQTMQVFPPFTRVFIKWHSDGSVGFIKAEQLHTTKARLPEFL